MENIKHINDLVLKFNKDENINNSIDFFLTLLIGLYEKIFLYQCIENLYLEAIILVLIITKAICKEIVVSSLIDKSIFIKPKAEDLIVGNEITNVISRKRIPEKVKWTKCYNLLLRINNSNYGQEKQYNGDHYIHTNFWWKIKV